jgi:hypothetical protein
MNVPLGHEWPSDVNVHICVGCPRGVNKLDCPEDVIMMGDMYKNFSMRQSCGFGILCASYF